MMSEFCHLVLSSVISLTVQIWSTHELSGQTVHSLPLSDSHGYFSFMFFVKISFLSSLNKSLQNLRQSLHKMTEKNIFEKNYQQTTLNLASFL